MFIKKVGYLLFVRLNLFRIIAKISPLLMLFSLLLIFFNIDLKQTYKFQEPSLRTKIFDIKNSLSINSINYEMVFDSIRYAKIEGMLSSQCILLAFPSNIEQSKQIRTIYQNYRNQQHNAKTLVFLSYSSIKDLKFFFDWYHNRDQNYKLSFGIIRVGINIQIIQQRKQNIIANAEGAKDKAYLKLFTSNIHPDLDYFMSIKQLLEKLNINWSPCQYIHKSKTLKSIKNEMIQKESQLKMFYEHALCELQEHINYSLSAHQIMMNEGFQSGTVKFIKNGEAISQKIVKLVFSFVKQYGMQQDHLHSASTFFYPLSKNYFAPMLYFLSPSLLSFISLVFILINYVISKEMQMQLHLDYQYIIIAYLAIFQYWYCRNYYHSLIMVIIMNFVSLIYRVSYIGKNAKGNGGQTRGYLQIFLISLEGLIGIYFGVFSFPLSYLSILLTIFMLIKPQHIIKKVIFQLSILILFFYLILYSQEIYHLNVLTSVKDTQNIIYSLSVQLQLCLLIPFIYFTI